MFDEADIVFYKLMETNDDVGQCRIQHINVGRLLVAIM